jgi:hypothetical protein
MGGIFVSAIRGSYRQLAKLAGRLLDRVSRSKLGPEPQAAVKIA